MPGCSIAALFKDLCIDTYLSSVIAVMFSTISYVCCMQIRIKTIERDDSDVSCLQILACQLTGCKGGVWEVWQCKHTDSYRYSMNLLEWLLFQLLNKDVHGHLHLCQHKRNQH